MRGVVYRGPRSVELVDDLPEPRVSHRRDAVVPVSATAMCGTDLHPYRGEIPAFEPGTVLGHEFVGTIVDAGEEVPVNAGDRVVASDVVACGRCQACARGWHYQCPQVTLFGYSTVVGPSLPGGQAEFVRVPFADTVLSPVPPELTDEEVLFVGDILSTGYGAVAAAGLAPGDVVGVVGGGPVGLCAAMCARAAGASAVVVADTDPSRREHADSLGFVSVAPEAFGTELARASDKVGARAVIEAVGSDAALRLAVEGAGPRSTVVAVGAHHSLETPFPAGTAFAHELTVRFVVGDPIAVREHLIPLLRAKLIDPVSLISHRLPLSDAVHAYDLFDRRAASKVVLTIDSDPLGEPS
ncbi:alcohol dehydrogenase catalytic domain-containing protein [Amycolatopsis sp. H20-H5]|uniref:alcohol dehydrogenase catalytic domain-containing protein n=1 Tax=Amycolatopsis sp. H20-H5 TaxID=3046309 RepID=UPI002DBEDC3D|nr:alcohol dehydrogenase catalytic domain-containing protein [Amycolatopsis sp. H20-H5]MEC3976889.1 alcohol dehydrogenase catalytic domain-containing protein [Amycolatopsis sp. H20-H5]